ncbi:GLTSCR protein, conserved region [Sesbania bispinosa]|nr:GLTSCR protein, conserved region [Sesbania bispinosa]
MIRPGNQMELQMAYQDAWRVCHPDFKRPFSSLEDACERLLPYHVVADYEAEEDDRILDSDTTGQVLSRSQQWDNNIAAKIAEFTATFEKQALAFNIISQKRNLGEFRSEERLMIEQALLQEEKRALLEFRAELESREKAGREAHEAKLRMAAMYQAEQARADSQSHAEMMSRAPLRGSALGSQGNDMVMGHDMGEQEQGGNPGELMNGWGNNTQRDEKEPSEDFLNDEAENGDTGTQDGWREVGEFDLNARTPSNLYDHFSHKIVKHIVESLSPLQLVLDSLSGRRIFKRTDFLIEVVLVSKECRCRVDEEWKRQHDKVGCQI